jgi:ribosomal protein L12E/L44/L45/RPP1/RPP2
MHALAKGSIDDVVQDAPTPAPPPAPATAAAPAAIPPRDSHSHLEEPPTFSNEVNEEDRKSVV